MKLMIALLLSACAGSAFALDCKNAVSTPEINECASVEQKKVEDKLNKVYQQVIKSIGEADTRKALVEAQRAWVQFREADCKAVYEQYKTGTIRTVMYIGCMQQHAEVRIKNLEDFQK
jgi:uncharacterized protein YecT (DUF1311 family)